MPARHAPTLRSLPAPSEESLEPKRAGVPVSHRFGRYSCAGSMRGGERASAASKGGRRCGDRGVADPDAGIDGAADDGEAAAAGEIIVLQRMASGISMPAARHKSFGARDGEAFCAPGGIDLLLTVRTYYVLKYLSTYT